MPRFVILEHDHPTLHWDLMLDVGEVLWTWRLAMPLVPGRTVAATRTFDHRRVYLDYEGPISGNRGSVKRYDHGDYDWLDQRPDCLIVALRGQVLTGVLLLRRTGEDWQAELIPDVSRLQIGEQTG